MKKMNLPLITLLAVMMGSGKMLIAAPPPPDTLPNIVFILVDDGRYDEYRPTGGPDWFVAPSIERIANEGANFTRTYAPTPICGPSRASIYSGLYGHQHGAEVNGDVYDSSLVTIQEILQAQGYFTGFIGKYGTEENMPTEFDFWLANPQEELYKDITYVFNGVSTFIPGHLTDVYNTYIQQFLDEAQLQQPFALFFFTNAPHPPNPARIQDKNLYNAEVMPFPAHFEEFESVYPDYYYEGTTDWTKDSVQTVKFIKDRYSCLIGVDENVETIFNFLDTEGITDETMMIFSSDNGYMEGDHMMRAKAYPIEESIHVPLFIRYPEWFDAGEVIENDLAELIDIPKTMMDLVEVTDIYGYEGISLNDLQEPDTMRSYVRYELVRLEDGLFDSPQVRGIRSFDHLYVKSWTNCYVEEFYDFVADPNQTQNQVLNPLYLDDVVNYRAILETMMAEVGDTEVPMENDGRLIGAYEIPDGIDNDCDGLVDDSIATFTVYPDVDDDGFGNTAGELIAYSVMSGYTLVPGDCDDFNPFMNPAAAEICDGFDNDCDGLTDDSDPSITGQTLYFADVDGDTYGNIGSTLLTCSLPIGYVTAAGDCNDGNAAIHPGVLDICDGINNDCDGTTDEDIITPVITAAGPTTFCSNSTNTLTATPSIPGFTYKWYKNGNPIAGATLITYSTNKTGTYTVKYTAPGMCVTTSNEIAFTVNKSPNPTIVNISALGSNDLCVNSPVKLTTQNKAGSTYQWLKDGAELAGATNNKYNTIVTGNFKVKRTDTNGCYGLSPTYTVVKPCREDDGLMDTEGFSIYPNPADHAIEIKANFGDYNGFVQFNIYNVLGDKVLTKELNCTQGNIEELINLPTFLAGGIYTVVLSNGEVQMNKQLIIN